MPVAEVAQGLLTNTGAFDVTPMTIAARERRHRQQRAGEVRLGTSGWSYDAWRAAFNPRAILMRTGGSPAAVAPLR